jgi:hypothetical protein
MGDKLHTPRNVADHVHRVSAALALVNTTDENPLDPKRWNVKEAYLIQIVAAMPWIYDGEAAKLVGRSLGWVRQRREHPDFKIAVQKLLTVVTRALSIQMEALQHRSFSILQERLESPDEDKRYEAAMAVLRGTGVLVPVRRVEGEVTHKLEDLDTESVQKIRSFILKKQQQERHQRQIAAKSVPLVIEGSATEINRQLREEDTVKVRSA